MHNAARVRAVNPVQGLCARCIPRKTARAFSSSSVKYDDDPPKSDNSDAPISKGIPTAVKSKYADLMVANPTASARPAVVKTPSFVKRLSAVRAQLDETVGPVVIPSEQLDNVKQKSPHDHSRQARRPDHKGTPTLSAHVQKRTSVAGSDTQQQNPTSDTRTEQYTTISPVARKSQRAAFDSAATRDTHTQEYTPTTPEARRLKRAAFDSIASQHTDPPAENILEDDNEVMEQRSQPVRRDRGRGLWSSPVTSGKEGMSSQHAQEFSAADGSSGPQKSLKDKFAELQALRRAEASQTQKSASSSPGSQQRSRTTRSRTRSPRSTSDNTDDADTPRMRADQDEFAAIFEDPFEDDLDPVQSELEEDTPTSELLQKFLTAGKPEEGDSSVRSVHADMKEYGRWIQDVIAPMYYRKDPMDPNLRAHVDEIVDEKLEEEATWRATPCEGVYTDFSETVDQDGRPMSLPASMQPASLSTPLSLVKANGVYSRYITTDLAGQVAHPKSLSPVQYAHLMLARRPEIGLTATRQALAVIARSSKSRSTSSDIAAPA